MQVKLKMVVLFFCYLLINVSNKHIDNHSITIITKNSQSTHTITTDSTAFETIVNFLKWYKQNKDKLNYRLVKGGKNSFSFYRVNFKMVKKYLSELKKSNFFSHKFIDDLHRYIVLCDSTLKKHPQNDFLARGFEADLITKLMDNVGVLENIDALKIADTKMVGSGVVIKIRSPHLEEMVFGLEKNAGIWKINSINGDFSAVIL